MLHTQLEPIVHRHLFVLHSYVASSPRPACHRGKCPRPEHHLEPPFHIEALRTLRQLTFAGITHKSLLEQQQRHNTCFPTGHSNACNTCSGIKNKKCPSESQTQWHLYNSITKKKKKIMAIYWEGGGFQASRIRSSGLVFQAFWREYTKISFQNSHSTPPLISPPSLSLLCSCWQNRVRSSNPPNDSLQLPPCKMPHVAVRKRHCKCVAGSKRNMHAKMWTWRSKF